MTLQCLGAVLQVLACGAPTLQKNGAERRSISIELANYLERLGPVSAKATRKHIYSAPDTSQESLHWLSEHYEGATLDWRRDAETSFMLDYSPKGARMMASRFADGATTAYNYHSRNASKQPRHLCRSGIS